MHRPLIALALLVTSTSAQRSIEDDVFRQLGELLPTPNAYRTASGAPGPAYWQQRADYVIDATLDDENRTLTGSETITYWNRSPDRLDYLWVQLDQNRFRPDAAGRAARTAPDFERFPYRSLKTLLARETFDGGTTIRNVADAAGAPLPHTINGTMMRIDLPRPLEPGSRVTFSIDWFHRIPESRVIRARGGYEHYEDDDNCVYGLAQWFPRMAAYTDYAGWQNKPFLGSGEFTLEFGDYEVRVTVPSDHVVSATGVLQNPGEVLTATQRERLERSRTAERPIFIVTPGEALANESSEPRGTQTWIWKAENVRDFAWASSRKFIWDALGVECGGRTVLCQSLYPKEGEPLWSRYSTHAVAHTVDVYSKLTFPYPYPTAVSICGPVGGGMEYPMICFNGPKPEEDGTYTKRQKYRLISIVIHEVGHNWFPMIVNSDERQWTWMDEGLNTFCQYLAEQEWEDDYPSSQGEPKDIVDYMASTEQVPIMTNSESLLQFGNNAYAKPATALNVLRETVMGRELFDFAFRIYARRWRFKRPEPADLFRSLEDASAVDLDWFWRGWFYTTRHVDIGIAGIDHYTLDTRDPDVDKPARKREREAEPTTIAAQRNEELPKRSDRYPELLDFYNEFDELDVTEADREEFAELLERLDDDEEALLATDRHFYVLRFENHGGLVMPVILELEWADGSTEVVRLPAEIWRRSPEGIGKLVLGTQELARVTLDPFLETADTDRANNHWPARPVKSRFQLFKEKRRENPMQRAQAEASADADGPDDSSEATGGQE